MSQGLLIAALGLAVTFTALGLLAAVMGAIGWVDGWRRAVAARRARAEAEGAGGVVEVEVPPETVAVIAAAVEAAAGRRGRIRTVRYLRDQERSWSRLGRLQVMASHAVVRREP